MSTTIMLLTEQVTKELYNSNLYLCMAGQFELLNLDGFSKEFRTHSDEEHGHAVKIQKHLLDRGHSVTVGMMDEVPSLAGKSALELAEMTYQAEIATTVDITAIANAASAEGDHKTYSFIQWFVDEQVEEEDGAAKLAGLLRINEPTAVLLLNQEWLED